MNLLSKFLKNSILTGPIESYCLACGCLLRSEEEAYTHIHKPGHVDKLNTVPRLSDYNDCIIKSKEGYFCQYCNIILPTIKRVSLHVTETKHGENKNLQCITRNAGVILAFNEVIINERSWNGLDGSTCSICNEDYDDEEDHKREASHILNLIQIKCEFGKTFVYRKVDDVLFFCLICNEILPILEKLMHHTSEKHMKFYEKSKTEATAVLKVPAIESDKVNKETNNNSVTLPTKDFKTKTKENKGKSGRAYNIDDDRTQTQRNIQESANLNTGNETSKLKNEIVCSKVSISDSLNNKNVEELENKPKPALTTNSTKETNTIPTLSENDVNGTTKADKAEPYLYEYLKANNFMLKSQEGTAYCTLCDVRMIELESGRHSLDPHHGILYAKHVARKKSQLSKNSNGLEHNTINKTSTNVVKETKASIVVDKENTPLNAQANLQKVASQASDKNEAKKGVTDSKDIDNNTAKQIKKQKDIPLSNEKQESVTEVKTTVIEETNKTQNKTKPLHNQSKECALTDKVQNPIKEKENHELPVSNARIKTDIKPESTETTAQPKKGSKKAQKKAAKPKAASTEAHETEKAVSQIPGHGETSTKENGSLTKASPEVLTNESNLETKSEVILDNSNIETDSKEQEKENDVSQTDNAAMTDADLKTEKLLDLLQTVSQVDSDSASDDVIINNRYVLGNMSFVLILRTDMKAECVACDEELTIDEIHRHIATDEHRCSVEECLVVTSLDDEFIRQVKTQEYHCGYCNMLLPNWDAMKDHLDSFQHSDAKTSASWRMERYRPHLKHCETKEVRSVIATIFRCTRE